MLVGDVDECVAMKESSQTHSKRKILSQLGCDATPIKSNENLAKIASVDRTASTIRKLKWAVCHVMLMLHVLYIGTHRIS